MIRIWGIDMQFGLFNVTRKLENLFALSVIGTLGRKKDILGAVSR